MNSNNLSLGFVLAILLPTALTQFSRPAFDHNILSHDWPQFVALACGRWCENGSLVIRPYHYCAYPRCYPCDCEVSCGAMGTCCPTLENGEGSYTVPDIYDIIVESEDTVIKDENDGVYMCVPLTALQYAFPSVQIIMFLSGCAPNWSDDMGIQRGCEDSMVLPPPDLFDANLPYCVSESRKCFRTPQCATCNYYELANFHEKTDGKEKQSTPTATRIDFVTECVSFDYVNEKLWDNLESSLECIVRLTPRRDTITTCLVSAGLPPAHIGKVDLYSLCFDLPKIPALLVMGEDGYQQIFCYLLQHELGELCPPSFDGLEDEEAIIDIRTYPIMKRPYSTRMCINRRVLGAENCWLVSCTEGKQLSGEEDTCESSVTGMVGRWYELAAIFTSLEALPENKDSLTINDPGLGSRGTFSYSYSTYSCPRDGGREVTVDQVKLNYRFKGDMDRYSDEFEVELERKLRNFNWKLKLNPASKSQKKELDNEALNGKEQTGEFQTEFPLEIKCIHTNCDFYLETTNLTNRCRLLHNPTHTGRMEKESKIFVPVSGVMTCPLQVFECYEFRDVTCRGGTRNAGMDSNLIVVTEHGSMEVSDVWNMGAVDIHANTYVCLDHVISLLVQALSKPANSTATAYLPTSYSSSLSSASSSRFYSLTHDALFVSFFFPFAWMRLLGPSM